jgi:hypothetical protein
MNSYIYGFIKRFYLGKDFIQSAHAHCDLYNLFCWIKHKCYYAVCFSNLVLFLTKKKNLW